MIRVLVKNIRIIIDEMPEEYREGANIILEEALVFWAALFRMAVEINRNIADADLQRFIHDQENIAAALEESSQYAPAWVKDAPAEKKGLSGLVITLIVVGSILGASLIGVGITFLITKSF
jgi:hypothetical protein